MRAVLFDFDYTLADSSAAVVDCFNYALAQMGFSKSSGDLIRKTIGTSLPESYCELSGDAEGERYDEFRQHFVQRGDEVMADLTHVFATVRPTAEILVAEGLSLGIVSTKFRRRITEVLERDDLLHLFEVIRGGEDVVRFKPDPSGLVSALELLGMAPSEALYVGDSVVDAETAKAAGVAFAAVLSGVTPREALAAYRPVAILDDLGGLPAVVL